MATGEISTQDAKFVTDMQRERVVQVLRDKAKRLANRIEQMQELNTNYVKSHHHLQVDNISLAKENEKLTEENLEVKHENLSLVQEIKSKEYVEKSFVNNI